jgi:hypothetical protein
MQYLRELHFMLGLRVTRDRAKRSLSLCQTHFSTSERASEGSHPLNVSPPRAKAVTLSVDMFPKDLMSYL